MTIRERNKKIDSDEKEGRDLTADLLRRGNFTFSFTNNFKKDEDNHVDCFAEKDKKKYVIEIKRRHNRYTLNYLLTDYKTKDGLILEKTKYDSLKEYSRKGYIPYFFVWTSDDKLIYFNLNKINDVEFKLEEVRKNNYSNSKTKKLVTYIPWSLAENFKRDIDIIN